MTSWWKFARDNHASQTRTRRRGKFPSSFLTFFFFPPKKSQNKMALPPPSHALKRKDATVRDNNEWWNSVYIARFRRWWEMKKRVRGEGSMWQVQEREENVTFFTARLTGKVFSKEECSFFCCYHPRQNGTPFPLFRPLKKKPRGGKRRTNSENIPDHHHHQPLPRSPAAKRGSKKRQVMVFYSSCRLECG